MRFHKLLFTIFDCLFAFFDKDQPALAKIKQDIRVRIGYVLQAIVRLVIGTGLVKKLKHFARDATVVHYIIRIVMESTGERAPLFRLVLETQMRL